MILNNTVFCCEVCTVPCFAYTGNIPPDRCIRGDLDVSEKANWVSKKPLTRINKNTCNRCGYEHIPSPIRDCNGKIIDFKSPKTCPNPKCRSPYWNKLRQIKEQE